MATPETNHVGSSGFLSQIDKKIKTLIKTKELLEEKEKFIAPIGPVEASDFNNFEFSSELSKLKEIQRERLLEDMSLILNDKIKELELKEEIAEEKSTIVDKLTHTLNEKIFQLEITNKKLELEKKHSQELNTKLEDTVKKLTEAEKELKVERDWLADQVEKKSLEVLDTIDQLIKAEKNPQ